MTNPILRALFGNTPVQPRAGRAMSNAQRQAQRQGGQFMDQNLYHGTFKDFDRFLPGNPDAAQGRNIYASTNPYDSSENYARVGGVDPQYNLSRQGNELLDNINDPDIKNAIFDSLSQDTQRFYGGNVDNWLDQSPYSGVRDAAKSYATEQMPSGGLVMPLALRPGKVMDLTYDPSRTLLNELPDEAGDIFAENVRDLNTNLPRRISGGLSESFDDMRYGNQYGGNNANARDFMRELQESPALHNANAADAAGNDYNPSAQIFSNWARDMGFPTQRLDPSLEFNQYADKSLYGDTRHYISEPNRFRSIFADFEDLKTDNLYGAQANPIPAMSSPEQLAQTSAPTDVPEQGTVPNPLYEDQRGNPLVQRPDMMTHPYREAPPLPQVPSRGDPTEEELMRYGPTGEPGWLEQMIEDPMTMLAGLGAFPFGSFMKMFRGR